MSRIHVVAGDFLEGEGSYRQGYLHIETMLHPWPGLELSASDILSIKIMSTKTKTNTGAALALGLAGSVAMGPIGALVGYGMAREERTITFLAQFKDGRSLLGVADESTYHRIENSCEAPWRRT